MPSTYSYMDKDDLKAKLSKEQWENFMVLTGIDEEDEVGLRISKPMTKEEEEAHNGSKKQKHKEKLLEYIERACDYLFDSNGKLQEFQVGCVSHVYWAPVLKLGHLNITKEDLEQGLTEDQWNGLLEAYTSWEGSRQNDDVDFSNQFHRARTTSLGLLHHEFSDLDLLKSLAGMRGETLPYIEVKW